MQFKMGKKVLMRMIAMLYGILSITILVAVIASPLMMSEGETPIWVYFLIYPLALLVIATQDICFKYFDKYE